MANKDNLAGLEHSLQKLVGETCDEIKTYTVPPDDPNYGKPYFSYVTENNYERIFPFLELVFRVDCDPIFKQEFHYRLGLLGTWHILIHSKRICSYIGGLDRDGQLLQHIKLFERQQVKRVVFIEENLNLLLEFGNNLWLGVFHDDDQLSGFKYSEIRYGSGGTDYTLCNGKVLWEWGFY